MAGKHLVILCGQGQVEHIRFCCAWVLETIIVYSTSEDTIIQQVNTSLDLSLVSQMGDVRS